MPEFIVGIPLCNEPIEIVRQTIGAIQQSEIPPLRVILVDHSDDDRTSVDRPLLDLLSGIRETTRVDAIRPQRNLGCAGAWNLIHRFCDPTTAIVINADCAVAPDTLSRMMQVSAPAAVFAYAFGCFRIDPSIRRAVGEFDEAFHPVYLEDADYRHRLRRAGVPLIEWPLDRQATISAGRERSADQIEHGKHDPGGYQGWRGDKLSWFHERVAANRARYLQKWGGEPRREMFSEPFDGQGDVAQEARP